MKTETKRIEIPKELLLRLEELRDATFQLANAVKDLKLKPMPAKPKGAAIEIDLETRRQLAAQAQFLGLRNPDELAQIVMHAFLQMIEEGETNITFPLALQQIETV